MSEVGRNKIDDLFAKGAPIDRAFQKAVQKAILLHCQLGFPIVEWRDGKLVWTRQKKLRCR
jgi:hypothetical protein